MRLLVFIGLSLCLTPTAQAGFWKYHCYAESMDSIGTHIAETREAACGIAIQKCEAKSPSKSKCFVTRCDRF